jgi:hypothetical protein
VAAVHSTQPFCWLTFLSLRDVTSNPMAPVLTQDATRRNSGTGKTISIVLAVISFFVVAACVLWGYFIPKWRHRCGRPSWTRFNCICGAAKYRLNTPPKAPRYVPRFPSHPGVRGLQKDCSLLIYDPRTETPFPTSPRTSEIVNLRSLTSTPATKPKIPSAFKRPTHDYELPKTPSTLSQLALTDSLGDHDVEEVDESQPGRLVMAPVARSAGQPPLLTKQLALFPAPASKSSKRFDTLAHPILLFEKFDKLDPRKTPPVSTASCLSGSTFTLKSIGHSNSGRNYMPQTAANVESELGEMDGAEVASGWAHEQSNTKDIVEPPVALPKPIHKSKPKTPVPNILDRYDRYAAGVKFIAPRNASLRRRLTPSTEPLNTGASVNSNDAILVPTPLHMRRTAARAAAASPTPLQASVRHTSPSERPRALSPGKFAPFSLQKSLKSKRYFRKSIGFYHCKSVVRTAVTIPKQTRINRGSWRGSSVYSRDMKSASILQDPACAPVIGDESGTSLPPDELSLGRANSTDLVRSKIDDWNLHTGDLHLSIPPVADRPQSDVGLRSSPLQVDFEIPAPLGSRHQENDHTILELTMPIPKILVGGHSDDVFDNGGSAQSHGRVLRVLDMEMASTEPSISRYCGKIAPGGAEWI